MSSWVELEKSCITLGSRLGLLSLVSAYLQIRRESIHRLIKRSEYNFCHSKKGEKQVEGPHSTHQFSLALDERLSFTDDIMVVLVHKCVQQTHLLALHFEYIPLFFNALNGLVYFLIIGDQRGDNLMVGNIFQAYLQIREESIHRLIKMSEYNFCRSKKGEKQVEGPHSTHQFSPALDQTLSENRKTCTVKPV